MNNRSNLHMLYLFRFFFSLIPAYVIERLYWEERGMTIQLVVYTEIIYAVTVFLLELPSGILADKWGRKQMMIIAAIMGCLEFLLLLFASSFWHFALVIFFAAVGRSASSGSEEALLYESLLAEGRASAFEKHWGRLNALEITATIIAALSGSMLAGRFGFELNYWLSLVSASIALVFAFTLMEPSRNSSVEEQDKLSLKAYAAAAFRFFRFNPGVCLMLLSGMVTGAAINYMDEFWQIYLERIEIPILYFGVFSAAIYVCRLPGNILAYQLKRWFGYRKLVSVTILMMALGFAYLAFVRDYTALAAMFLVCLFSGLIQPLAAGYLQHRLDSSMRATIGSFQSLGENALLILAGLGFGYFAAQWDVFGGYGFIAIVCGVFLVYFWFAARKWLE